jgi:hypothetical protein
MNTALSKMHRRRFFHLGVTALCLASACLGLASKARSAEPKDDHRALRVVVDPRLELMSLIFRLAGNPEYGKGNVPSYVDDVEKQFGEFRDHPAVELARKLRQTRGVSFDAVMSMAVHLTDAYTLDERVPFDPRPENLDGRWPTAEARKFLAAARQFVQETSFRKFIEDHQPLYELTESRMQQVLDAHGHLEWFDEFFGERPQASFTVALGLLNGPNCYGPRLRMPDGKEELFCILGVWVTDREGMPWFNKNMLETVTHEFCHSYTNPIVDRHEAEFAPAGKKIFPHVEAAMRRQAYGNWKTVIYESLVRACVIRYTRKHRGRIVAWLAIQEEKLRSFSWMEELSDLLGEYESNRDQYLTLDDFAPRLVAFFDEYAEKLGEKEEALEADRPKVVSTTPADGAADVDPDLAAIQVVFDRPMEDGSWSLVGGGPNFPETSGKPAYDDTKTTWTVPVKLKPGWSYRFMLNSDRFQNFRSREGVPLKPVEVSFRTAEKPPKKSSED